MSTVFTIIHALIILGLAYAVTWKLIPWLYVKLVRLLGGTGQMTPITKKRVMRFKRIKRGYWSFRLIVTLFVASLFLEMIVNDKPLIIRYEGKTAFPAVAEWGDKVLFFTKISSWNKASDFGQVGDSGVDYHEFAAACADPGEIERDVTVRKTELAEAQKKFERMKAPGPKTSELRKKRYESKQRSLDRKQAQIDVLEKNLSVFRDGDAFTLMPLYPYSPGELRLDIEGNPPLAPSFAKRIPLGTDESGRDIVPLMAYGFRISLSFALIVALIGYTIGIVVGGIQGYFGGWVDIFSQRFVVIWGSIPFLFVIMIVGTMVERSLGLLIVFMVILRSWLGITYYVRAEFFREKSKDYVQAAIGAGVSDAKIILRHILPNSLVPVVTFAPFGIVAYIGSLVSLDYLGFGLPPGTPSWGALLRQGLGENLRTYPHLAIIAIAALAVTLFCVVMIGEAVREAFDPKVFSRLR
jgi:microcin C transport system permease protein